VAETEGRERKVRMVPQLLNCAWAYAYLCVFCAKRCGTDTIEYSACDSWVHRHVGSLHMATGSRGGLFALKLISTLFDFVLKNMVLHVTGMVRCGN